MQREWLISLIPLTIGVGSLGFGVYGLRRARALRRTGVTAPGRIVRHQVQRGDEGAKYHFPVAAWTTEDGRACEHASRFGRGSIARRFGVGAHVVVLYDPDEPRRFEIQGWDVATVDRLFTVLGSLLTVGTLVALLIGLLTL
ncbi:DUF3592 domain-containing protein [Streptomyces sp. NPDC059382]|uniref:DUF3592 domain-containing protein n=1 Tax=Streptomyces sp. NPDC059382 TaxID=3346816 RepID=UPI0036D03374